MLPKHEKRFLKFIKSWPSIESHSQLFQDFLPLFFLDRKIQGFFVEVGVGNGVDNSNSYMLENQFQWNGILVEPNPVFSSSILKNRKSKLVKMAAGGSDDSEHTLIGTQNGEYSYIKTNFSGKGNHRKAIFEQVVKTKTLNLILQEAMAPKIIDFLSVDVEGFELEVLKGINFTEWKFKVVCIEHNYNEVKKANIQKILHENGYINMLPYASQFDSYYVHAILVGRVFE